METNQVGKTIHSQLLTLGRMTVWSWGANSYKALTSEHFTDIPHLGGLLFKVNGMVHKGHVMIRLNPNDTYHISIGKLSKGKFTSKKTFDEVYFDQMVGLIDESVETKI